MKIYVLWTSVAGAYGFIFFLGYSLEMTVLLCKVVLDLTPFGSSYFLVS